MWNLGWRDGVILFGVLMMLFSGNLHSIFLFNRRGLF